MIISRFKEIKEGLANLKVQIDIYDEKEKDLAVQKEQIRELLLELQDVRRLLVFADVSEEEK